MALADTTGASDFTVFRLLMVGSIAISVSVCHLLLGALYPGATALRTWVSIVILFCLLGLPGAFVFGEREHILVILFLPYFLLSCCRLVEVNPSRSMSLLIGAGASLGVALKPHFLLPWLMLEALLLYRQ